MRHSNRGYTFWHLKENEVGRNLGQKDTGAEKYPSLTQADESAV